MLRYSLTVDGKRCVGVIDTHRVPANMGGRRDDEGGGLLICYQDQSALKSVSSLVEWILLQLQLYGIKLNSRTSLLCLHLQDGTVSIDYE